LAIGGVQAVEMGLQLNLNMNGHRLADFPHAALHKAAPAAVPFTPNAHLAPGSRIFFCTTKSGDNSSPRSSSFATAPIALMRNSTDIGHSDFEG